MEELFRNESISLNPNRSRETYGSCSSPGGKTRKGANPSSRFADDDDAANDVQLRSVIERCTSTSTSEIASPAATH
jgi:hypothetical protein